MVMRLMAATLLMAAAAACGGSGESTDERVPEDAFGLFVQAVQSGEGCAELYEVRDEHEQQLRDVDRLDRVDERLRQIGCDSPDATRSD